MQMLVVLTLLFACFANAQQPGSPNILWITSEANDPHLGAYTAV